MMKIMLMILVPDINISDNSTNNDNNSGDNYN